jgi:hypothetical protein
MSNFAQKHFQGEVYTFEHLNKFTFEVALNIGDELKKIQICITFGCHCFTEEFDPSVHKEEHRYKHKNEERAFDLLRYECSKHLPTVINSLLSGTIYRSDRSYTYVAQIFIPSLSGSQPYSIFFSLEKIRPSNDLVLDMYIKSAYLSPLKSGKHAENWRFKGLIGEIAGLF